jgi:hypothetical protein
VEGPLGNLKPVGVARSKYRPPRTLAMSSKSSPFAAPDAKPNTCINLCGLTVKDLSDTLTRILVENPEVASYSIIGAQGLALTSYVQLEIEHEEERCVLAAN